MRKGEQASLAGEGGLTGWRGQQCRPESENSGRTQESRTTAFIRKAVAAQGLGAVAQAGPRAEGSAWVLSSCPAPGANKCGYRLHSRPLSIDETGVGDNQDRSKTVPRNCSLQDTIQAGSTESKVSPIPTPGSLASA